MREAINNIEQVAKYLEPVKGCKYAVFTVLRQKDSGIQSQYNLDRACFPEDDNVFGSIVTAKNISLRNVWVKDGEELLKYSDEFVSICEFTRSRLYIEVEPISIEKVNTNLLQNILHSFYSTPDKLLPEEVLPRYFYSFFSLRKNDTWRSDVIWRKNGYTTFDVDNVVSRGMQDAQRNLRYLENLGYSYVDRFTTPNGFHILMKSPVHDKFTAEEEVRWYNRCIMPPFSTLGNYLGIHPNGCILVYAPQL